MSTSCPDCGCRMSGGVCSNCQEELYILREQVWVDGTDMSLSKDFTDKAEEQKEYLKRRKH